MATYITLPRYFITFTTYGTWLHGDVRGSVTRDQNGLGQDYFQPDEEHFAEARCRMVQPAYVLDHARRLVVLDGIVKLFQKRSWELNALHVRSNHLHLLCIADRSPERIMLDCKAFASRELNKNGFESSERRRWTRGGSTRWLNHVQEVHAVREYITEGQGDVMSLWIDDEVLVGTATSTQ